MRASNRPARKSALVSNPWILLSRGEICGSFARSKGCANFQLALALLKERAARMPARFFSYLDEDAYFFSLMSTPVATRRLTNHRAGARNTVRRSALTSFCGPDRDQRRIAKNRCVSPRLLYLR